MYYRFFTYIVECNDESFYTGVTSRLEKRIEEHNSEDFPGSYCHTRRPVKLAFARKFNSPRKAIEFEKQVKRWSRVKKFALINNDIESLKILAQCRNESHSRNKGDGIGSAPPVQRS